MHLSLVARNAVEILSDWKLSHNRQLRREGYFPDHGMLQSVKQDLHGSIVRPKVI